MPSPKEIYGIRVVPKQDENGLAFGGFIGIVINCTYGHYNNIDILKMVQDQNGYYVESSVTLDFLKVQENSQTSGKAKAEYLLFQAEQFAEGYEKIAICETLVPDFMMLDALWETLN
ncbi:MAG: hypothetical protein IKF52_02275 [Clostridia bacterium]|nr:hypothetical protein [Clostridia bacterium]